MAERVAEKACLVAGGSGRLGGAVAVELARRGWLVGVHCHARRAEAERVAAECGGGAFALGADLRSRPAADNLVAGFVERAGAAPGCLVVATGLARDAPLIAARESDWDETVAVNLSGLAWLLRAAAARWVEADPPGGQAVLIGSNAGLAGREGGAAYGASKAALMGLMRSVARELGGRGVRVNVLIPPFIPEGMGLAASEAFRKKARRESVAGRTGSAEEFARFVADMAETRGVSGQVLAADTRILPW